MKSERRGPMRIPDEEEEEGLARTIQRDGGESQLGGGRRYFHAGESPLHRNILCGRRKRRRRRRIQQAAAAPYFSPSVIWRRKEGIG